VDDELPRLRLLLHLLRHAVRAEYGDGVVGDFGQLLDEAGAFGL